jgi:flagellar M-ring protein FliF
MIGSTPMTQRVNYLRAQQVELTRTIMHVVPIVSARVHIVQPDGNSPFLRDKKPTTASILVTLRPGATLRPETVAGLVSLASGSVEGLMPENVRILDASGRLLSEQHDPDSRWPTSFLNQRKEVEHYLSREAERMLEGVLGTGRAIVHVNADISSKTLDETKEIISPEGKLIVQEKTMLDKVTPGAAAKGGPVGTASNTSKASSTTSTGGNSVKETQESTYKYPTIIQKWQSKHGAIERLSVAVLVDTSANPELTVASVEDLVKQAVGFTIGRDQIKVSPVKIATIPPPEPVDVDQHSLQRWQTVLSIVRYVSIGMVALCAFPILWVLFRRRAPSPVSDAAQAEPEKLKIITRELERNPEALAAILASWIDKSDTTETRRAA